MALNDRNATAEILIAEVELMNSSANRINEWYKSRIDENGSIKYADEVDEIVERRLLEKNDPLIDITIAKYAIYEETIRQIFLKSIKDNNDALTLACLSNTSIARRPYSLSSIPDCLFNNDKQILEWLEKITNMEVYTLFSNETITESFLIDFLEGKESWKILSDEKRLNAIQGLYKNKRMSQVYDDSYMDGFAEYRYNKVFELSWKLSEVVPVNAKWAANLYSLYTKLPKTYYGKEAIEVAKRWLVKIDDEQEDIKKRGYLNFYELLRAEIYKGYVKYVYDKDGGNRIYFNEEDIALRYRAYRNLKWSADDIQDAYDKDGHWVITAFIENYSIWKDPVTRQALHDICWDASSTYEDSRLDSPNHYNAVEERIKEKHPAWFIENDEEIIYDEDLPVNMGRLKESLSVLQESTLSQNTELLEQILRVEKEGKKKSDILLVLICFVLVLFFWKLL